MLSTGHTGDVSLHLEGIEFMNKIAALCSIVFLGSAVAANATVITYDGSASGGLSASATFTTSAGVLQLVLTNTTAGSAIISSGQAISGISFVLSNAPGTLGTTTASGQMGNVSGSGVVTDISGSPSRFLGTSPGSFNISGSDITLDVLGGGMPTEMIAPCVSYTGTTCNTTGTYTSVNNGFQNFIPYTIGPGTFTLDLSGVSANTTISSVDFYFGTANSPTPIAGCVTQNPPPITPEPSSLLLMGTGILGAAGLFYRRLGSGEVKDK
jgi:hypothetical protein